ncbi:MAG: hypothetical protein KJP10_04855 [Gammaproteobacteria bacterium]|nr:hypothetical protein [Gammaproteobacteria bacterium]
MADDDIEEFDFDDGDDAQDDIEYEDTPPPQPSTYNARRELEKRLELKRLKEMLGSSDFDEDF